MKNTKQTAKHTAGEWVYVELGDFIDKQYGVFQKKNTKNALLARVSSEANARLIASAPLMLEALEAVLNMGDDYEAEKLVRKAIATARGE